MSVPVVLACIGLSIIRHMRLIRAASLLAIPLLVWLWSQRVILLIGFNS